LTQLVHAQHFVEVDNTTSRKRFHTGQMRQNRRKSGV